MSRRALTPIRKPRALHLCLVALALLTGCAALGKETPFSEPVSTSGVGPFRRLTDEETRFRGRAIELGNVAVDRASFAGGSLFYGAAPALDPLPVRNPALPVNELDPAQLEPFRIFRSSTETEFGFDPGTVLLTASEAWEGGYVTQPFALELADGSVRLYYAAAGGIGVAVAQSADGTFTRNGDGLALANNMGVQAAGLRSPAVAQLDGTYYLYADDGVDVWVATSVDGLTFTLLDTDDAAAGVNPLAIPGPADEDDPMERAHVSPAAVVATSPTGRTTLRLYVEAQQVPEDPATDDDRIILALASLDGVSFERARLPAHEAGDSPGQPTLRPYQDGVSESLMYMTVARGMNPQLRAVVLAVDPGRASFAPEAEMEAMP